jgi:hypothetical protein
MLLSSSSPVVIRPVQCRADMKQFIELPWSIYRDDPCWAPPLKSSLAKLLNIKKHPFWQFAQRELFLAKRDKITVGRIAAIVDTNLNTYHDEKICVWGFFECINDQEVATQLFDAVEAWACKKGMTRLRGPLNPSTNYEIGILIKGFKRDPALMMTYNPSYYPEIIYRAGLRKEKDILSYRLTREFTLPEWVDPIAENILKKNNITIHCPEKWTRENIRLLNNIYKDCWADNWGFVPMTNEEEDEMAKELLFLIEPRLAFFIYCGDEPAGIGLMLPDFNPLLKRFNGSLGLMALVKKYLYMSEVTGLRGLLFGVKQKFRLMGLHLIAMQYAMSVLKTMEQYNYVEMGWTLEDNDAINNLFQESGLAPDKRYRIYTKPCKSPHL